MSPDDVLGSCNEPLALQEGVWVAPPSSICRAALEVLIPPIPDWDVAVPPNGKWPTNLDPTLKSVTIGVVRSFSFTIEGSEKTIKTTMANEPCVGCKYSVMRSSQCEPHGA